MADNGKSKKAGRSKKGDLGKLTTAKHRARRIKKDAARKEWCARARSLGHVHAISRAIRRIRRSESQS